MQFFLHPPPTLCVHSSLCELLFRRGLELHGTFFVCLNSMLGYMSGATSMPWNLNVFHVSACDGIWFAWLTHVLDVQAYGAVHPALSIAVFDHSIASPKFTVRTLVCFMFIEYSRNGASCSNALWAKIKPKAHHHPLTLWLRFNFGTHQGKSSDMQPWPSDLFPLATQILTFQTVLTPEEEEPHSNDVQM